jgi:polyphosphate kinase
MERAAMVWRTGRRLSAFAAPAVDGPEQRQPYDTFHTRTRPNGLSECTGFGCDGIDDTLLAYNAHLLDLAVDPSTPPLERLRFLGIVGGNLDEFFAVRIGEARIRLVHPPTYDPDLLPLAGDTETRIVRAERRATALARLGRRTLWSAVRTALAERGLLVRHRHELSARAKVHLEEWFQQHALPYISPPTHEATIALPHIPAFGLAVVVEDRAGRVFVMPVSDALPRWVQVRDGRARAFVPLEEVLAAHWPHAGSGHPQGRAFVIRVTRALDARVDSQRFVSRRLIVEDIVARRPFNPVIRLEAAGAPRGILRQMVPLFRAESPLAERVGEACVVDGRITPIALSSLHELAALPHPELRYPSHNPRSAPARAEVSLFASLRHSDVFVHFPQDAFEESVGRFLNEAATDPLVTHLYVTLYRTDAHGELVDTLIRARQAGKHVTVVVELLARLEEARNLRWADRLAAAGCAVLTGPAHLKVHAKIGLVLRHDDSRTAVGGGTAYAFISSGNLNPTTARQYRDFALLTARRHVTEEVRRLFRDIVRGTVHGGYRHLLVSPGEIRSHLLRAIAAEAARGEDGLIRAKLNGLDDPAIIAALYDASRAGTPVELIVRGLCTLRPGVPGQSEHIRVVSIVGRYLEHGRIYAFGRGLDVTYWIGSADWRTRNFDRRIEAAVQVLDPNAAARLEHLLTAQLRDPRAWTMRPDRSYTRLGEPPHSPTRV